jgi:hypothetical protein
MPTSSYMPKDDSGKADLLDHVAATLPKYAAMLDISAEELASLQADAVAFRYALNLLSPCAELRPQHHGLQKPIAGWRYGRKPVADSAAVARTHPAHRQIRDHPTLFPVCRSA